MRSALPLSLAAVLLGTLPALALSEADRASAIAAAGFEDVEQCAKGRNGTVEYDVEPIDLNIDGTEEAVVTAREAGALEGCIKYGRQRSSLMVKDASGKWKANIQNLYEPLKILAEKAGGYPDIQSGRGHFCRPVWRWATTQYETYRVCRYGQFLLAQDAGTVSPVQAYDHNGSRMAVNFNNGVIQYAAPKASIAGTVKPETTLFEGRFTNQSDVDDIGTIEGTAYVFKKGCAPAPYRVTGSFDGTGIYLSGPAPSRMKNSCAVAAVVSKSPHANLSFYPLTSGNGEYLNDKKEPGFTLPMATTQVWSAGANEVRGAMDHTANVYFFREGERWRIEAECQATNMTTRKWSSLKGRGYALVIGSTMKGDAGPVGRFTLDDAKMTFENSFCGSGEPSFGTGD